MLPLSSRGQSETIMSDSQIKRFSSRRQPLDHTFLAQRLKGAQAYDRIAGYFSSSLLEVVGEELETVEGTIRVICNSNLHPLDVRTARAAKMAVRRSWTSSEPEALLDSEAAPFVQERFRRLYELLRSGKLRVRVLPDKAFGLIHGKAGVITLADGSKTSFIGSTNESKLGWKINYELVWEDSSPDAISWVQDEFDALWGSAHAVSLADAVIQDIERLSKRKVLYTVQEWEQQEKLDGELDAAPVVIEAPVFRREVGLWDHQKYFVKLAFESHRGPIGKARYVLADQVGLGKTLQLAMTAQLIGLTSSKPILIICPKTLIWQWQGEMRDLLDMPSAVWDGRRWIDENGIEYPALGVEGITKCPRRVGIVSSGLITRRSAASKYLRNLDYECVILDEAHRARRRNLGEGKDGENPDPNNLLRFMYEIAFQTRSLLLATATPVQIRPVEAWDLLDILSRGDDSVLGNPYSYWHKADEALDLVMERVELPKSEVERWEWTRNPLPPKKEDKDFEIIRRRLNVPDFQSVIPGDTLMKLRPPDRARLQDLFPRLVFDHNPFIRRIVRRTRQQLETQIDPETNEPLLKPIGLELFGESDNEAILLPVYLQDAYKLAEEFCKILGQRMKGSGFLKTLLLRRVGSSIAAGLSTAEKILDSWGRVDLEEEDEDIGIDEDDEQIVIEETNKILTEEERSILERFVSSLKASQERDPKYPLVVEYLRDRDWLELGCIIFSQYRDSIQWLVEQLTKEFPKEPIALYSGPMTSGIMQDGYWEPKQREHLKKMVFNGEIRLMLGTDAASEGINLQKLATLINLDLPWNPTRLEQRKGRIQRIGQIHDTVFVYNMRYKGSVEDRVHQLLSSRLRNIYQLFGQIPDVLEDVWVALALGDKEQAEKIIDSVPEYHPFELRYSEVQKIDWETCQEVLDENARKKILMHGW